MARRVLVVGGGASGLYALRLLHEHGAEAQLLEARNRLGGRLHTIQTPEGIPLDLGGQWIAPQHTRALALIQKHRIPLSPTPLEGKNYLILGGKKTTYTGTIPKLPPWELISLGWALHKLNRYAQRISTDTPWQSPPRWDTFTLAHWAHKNIPFHRSRTVFELGLATVLACQPEEISFLHTLFYIRGAGNVENLIESRGAAQDAFFTHGAQSFIEALSEGLPYHLGKPVRFIRWTPNQAQLYTTQGEVFTAEKVIFAVPPTVMGSIVFEPPLPPARLQLHQRMPMGSIIKVLALYPEPFWRHKGLSGHGITDQGTIAITFDGTPHQATYGKLVGFAVGKKARALLYAPENERQNQFANDLKTLWGPQAPAPLHLTHKLWAEEPLSGGGYVGFMPPGVWTHFGAALRAPVGPFHWAGTETATYWPGYIEGALQAAERAVEEVLS
ncbi:MAG: flavin monoamine oxidase family protein [Bacteroidia bacterium]